MAKKKITKRKSTEAVDKSTTVQSSSVIPSILIALVALALGIVSTPVWVRIRESPSWTSSNSPPGRTLVEQNIIQQQRFPCNPDTLSGVLHDNFVYGLHVLCLAEERPDQIQVVTYGGAVNSQTTNTTLSRQTSFIDLKAYLTSTLNLPAERDQSQPWAIFNPIGERVVDASLVETSPGQVLQLLHTTGMGLLYSGGQFLWPGVRIGYRRPVDLYSVMPIRSPKFQTNRTVMLETLSLTPLVLAVDSFLSEEECDHIQELATPTMEYSGVVLMDHDQGKPASDFRTSQSTFVSAQDDMMIDIDYRTASLVRIPRNHQETVQVLRYQYNEKLGRGEHYDSHTDYFDASLYQKDPGTLSMIKGGRRNRLATVFWYLSDVEQGGETVFPRMNGGRERHFRDCETGLVVKPERGKIIIFYSLTQTGDLDPNSLHGACEVKEGVKWAANKWVWNEPMGYVPL